MISVFQVGNSKKVSFYNQLLRGGFILNLKITKEPTQGNIGHQSKGYNRPVIYIRNSQNMLTADIDIFKAFIFLE